MRLSFKYDSSRFESLTLNQRVMIRNFSFTNKLLTFVLKMIQIFTIITCKNEISKRRTFKFSISLKKIFFQNEFFRFIESFVVCETRKRNRRDKHNDKNVFQWRVISNRSCSFYDCCRSFSLNELTRIRWFWCFELFFQFHVDWSCLFDDKLAHNICTNKEFESKTKLERNFE